MTTREVVERTQLQGEDERIAYTVTTTNWASSPTAPSVVVKDTTDDSDVTATVMPGGNPGAPSGDVITLTLLRDLTAGVRYRVEIQFTSGGNLFECYFFVECEV